MAITVGGFMPFSQQQAKAADYTIVAADNGSLFTTAGATGAIGFTLPSLAPNLVFYFFNAAIQNMVITSPSATVMVTFNNALATSVGYTTTSSKVGGACMVYSLNDGTKWYHQNLGQVPFTVA